MSKSCFFTGHRILKITDTLSERLRETLIKFIENGATDFYAGVAIGWDMLCENTVLQLKACYPLKNYILFCLVRRRSRPQGGVCRRKMNITEY